jgi:hypothetical protein
MRCLSTALFTIVGLLMLAAGLYLLFIVFIDTPETRAATVGGSAAAAGEVDPPDPEIRQAQAEQAAELDATTADGRNPVFNNPILSNETDITVLNNQLDAATTTAPETRTPMGADSVNGQGGFGGTFEQRVVELEWPEQFRTGEGGAVRVTLKPLPDGGLEVSSPEIATNAIFATPISLQNCYADYNAFVTAQIIAPEFDIETPDEDRKLLREGGEVTWRWTLTPDTEGTFVITLALRMDWEARAGVTPALSICNDLAARTYTFWGQSVQVEVVRVLGLITIDQASLAGTVLAVLGTASQIPFTLEILGVLFERRINRRADARRNRRAARNKRRNKR